VLVAMGLIAGLMILSFQYVPSLALTSLAVFTVGWVGQFYGHKLEGKKPSFIKDLQFILIGPVWVLYKLAPRFFSFTNSLTTSIISMRLVICCMV